MTNTSMTRLKALLWLIPPPARSRVLYRLWALTAGRLEVFECDWCHDTANLRAPGICDACASDPVDLVPVDCEDCGYPLEYCACGGPHDLPVDVDCDGCGGPISDPGLCEACVQNFNNDPAGDLSDYVDYLEATR